MTALRDLQAALMRKVQVCNDLAKIGLLTF